MDRRKFLNYLGATFFAGTFSNAAFGRRSTAGKQPNIIFILADDLGYAELGCYGQKKIRTPNIDALCADGMRFTQAYSGNPVCAPSRCVFLTGKHCGHSYIRDNSEVGTWDSYQGQKPLATDEVTIAELLKRVGYATACIGKWGLGRVGSSGDPNLQGFDLFFGYNCQRQAHNYYPRYLMRNSEKVKIEGNDRGLTGKHYAPDLMADEAFKFIKKNKSRPFFLYYATTVPHVALQVPEDSMKPYESLFDEKPYDGGKGYLPQPKPRSAYAGMVSRMDRDVGRMVKLLDQLGLRDNTLVIFTSDNGPTFNGGSDSAFFESTGPLSGLKCSLYEGGIREPFIAAWPGHIKPGTKSDLLTAHWDMLPTFAQVAGFRPPKDIDGVSILPTLLGKGKQEMHQYLYWERPGSQGGGQALRMGDWKGLRTGLRRNPDAPLKLFNLKVDIGEKDDVAAEHPEIAKKILRLMKEAHVDSKEFPLFGKRIKPKKLSNLPVISRKNWKLVRASSESSFNKKFAICAFDGNPNTWWHSKWNGVKAGHPNELVIDMGKEYTVRGMRCLPRTDGHLGGLIKDFEFFVSDDPDKPGKPVVKGKFLKANFEQEVLFHPVKGRYIFFRSLSDFAGAGHASIAELNVLGE